MVFLLQKMSHHFENKAESLGRKIQNSSTAILQVDRIGWNQSFVGRLILPQHTVPSETNFWRSWGRKPAQMVNDKQYAPE